MIFGGFDGRNEMGMRSPRLFKETFRSRREVECRWDYHDVRWYIGM